MTAIRSQQGLAAAAILLIIILGAIALMLGRGVFQPGADLSRREVTTDRVTRISMALVDFAKLQARLPCPARGDQDTGEENRTAASTDCTKDSVSANDGVVPWKTLGLRRDDAIDGWARKISYRVYSGATGFTQDSGLNMTNCNTSLGTPISTSLGSGSLCQSAVSPNPPPNTPTQFWAARTDMLAVQDLGTAKTNIAFALISHGESGYGSFLAEVATSRTSIPGGRATEETTNAGAAGTYHILQKSETFDDVLTYKSAADLISDAKMASRSWKESPLSATFSASAVEAAAPGFNSSSSDDTGLTSLSMGGMLITASASGATRNVGFREQSGVGGLGAIGGSSTSGDLNSSLGESLTFQLGTGSEFGKMDVALNAFQITNNIPLQEERAEISFWKGGTVVQTTTIDAWDDQGNPSECSYRLVSGQSFDRMDVAAISQTNSGGSTRFTVAGVKACSDSTTSCDSLPGADRCPIPPPSALSGPATGINKTTATLQGIVENNGVSIGTGTGYITSASTSDGIGNNFIDLTSGSGTILAGNCLTFQGDGNTYVVETGIAAPGTIRIADPGLFQAIPLSSPRIVTLTPCITSTRFDFGTTLGYGFFVTASPATINAGSGSTCITAPVTGLTCGTTYYYRARATNLANTTIHTSITTGSNSSFSTAACSALEPSANSLGATNIGTSTARLNGTVNDNGMLTTVTFEYGLTPCYGSSVAAAPATLNAGTGSTAVMADLTGLACNTYYYYRVVAANSTATTAGNATLFQTAACP